MPATIVNGQLVEDGSKVPPQSDTLDQVRLELETRGAGAPEWVSSVFQSVIDIGQRFTAAIAEAEKTGLYTEAGLRVHRKNLGAAAIAKANALDQEAAEIEPTLTAKAEAKWNWITDSRPTFNADGDARFMRYEAMVRRLEREDPVIFEQIVLQAARDGQDSLLRAIFTVLVPPYNISKDQKWQNPIGNDLRLKIKDAVFERLSPQGDRAFKALRLRGLAKTLRSLVSGK